MTFLKGVPTSQTERLAVRLALKERFGDILYDSALDKLEKEFTAKKSQIEREKQQKKQKEEKQWRKEYNRPINVFARLLRSGYHRIDPSHLEDVVSGLDKRQRQQLFDEYKKRMKQHALPLAEEATNFGYQFLLIHLSKQQNTRGEGIWKKLKTLHKK